MPSAVKTASNALANRESRSRSKNVKAATRSLRSPSRFRACCATQAPRWFAVTPSRWMRRVACSTTNSTDNRWSSSVSTQKSSVARMPRAGTPRNCRQGDRRGEVRGRCRSLQDQPHRTRRNLIAEPGESPWIRR